jgi:hypothetical protein
MLDHQHALDARHAFQRGVDIGLQRHMLAAAHAGIGADDEPAGAILDPPRQRFG